MFKVIEKSQYQTVSGIHKLEVIHPVNLSAINTIINGRLDIETYSQSAYMPKIELVLRLDIIKGTLTESLVEVLNNMAMWNNLNITRTIVISGETCPEIKEVLTYLEEEYRPEEKYIGTSLSINIPITDVENIRSIRTGLLVEKELLRIKHNLRLVLDTNLVTCS